MLILLSPSKKLSISSEARMGLLATAPIFLEKTAVLIKVLSAFMPAEFQQLMGLSEKLARLNYERYQVFSSDFDVQEASAAILTFKGNVYDGLDAASLTHAELIYANRKLRILSGLYGVLKPFDLIQAYRLDMGTALSGCWGKNLYDFWGDTISSEIKVALDDQRGKVLINLASQEYYKAIKSQLIGCPVLTISFKEYRQNQYKAIMPYLKKARGLMARYIIQHHIEQVEEIKQFSEQGYRYNVALSEPWSWVFTRDLSE